MADKLHAIRWTIQMAANEFGFDRQFLTKQIKGIGAVPGEDGKFSTRQITEALFGSAKLEREAREAKFRQQIDEAEMSKNERDIQEGRLAYVTQMKEFVTDLTTRFVQMIRQSDLKDAAKKQWVAEISGLKFEPTKLVPFEK